MALCTVYLGAIVDLCTIVGLLPLTAPCDISYMHDVFGTLREGVLSLRLPVCHTGGPTAAAVRGARREIQETAIP